MLKDKLNAILAEYRKLIEKVEADTKTVDASTIYVETYKARQKEKIFEEFAQKQQEYKAKVLDLIRAEKQRILDQRKPRDFGPDYDIKLSNALKILELAGADMMDEEIRNIIQPFQGDYPTMQALRRILINQGKENIVTPDMLENQRLFALTEIEKAAEQAFYREYSMSNWALMNLQVALQYFGSVLDEKDGAA